MAILSENLDEFLKPTDYCDYSNVKIETIAKEIISKHKNQTEQAIAAFYFVRDSIKYKIGIWKRSASETLLDGDGTCTNKANLLIALLRACNIPAGYGVMKVNGREYFGTAMLEIFKKRVAKVSTHIYAYVYLNNKWIKVDPSDDKRLCQNTNYFNYTTQLVDWDGYQDAKLNLKPEHILEDKGPIANIDYIFNKKPKNAKGVNVKVGNLYISFLRDTDKKFKTSKELEKEFKFWLRKYHLRYYLGYKLFPIYKIFIK
jgi:hypothetical protein